MGLYRQIMEFKYKQACEMIKTGILVRKTKKMKSYRSIFFALVAICLKLNDELTYLTASSNLKTKLTLYAGRLLKNVHYRRTPFLNTLVGSVRYLTTLLKYRLFHYIVELYPTFLHC